MMRFISILLFCSSVFAQGLTLLDVAFVGASGNTGGGGGGGGSSAPAPTEYWDFQEVSGNRVGEVSGTIFAEDGGSIADAAGLYGNAASIPNSFSPPSYGFAAVPGPSYSTGQDLSVNYWLKWVDTDVQGYLTELDIWAGGYNDLIQLIYNPYGGGGPQPTNTFRAAVWHGVTSDQVDSSVIVPSASWLMLTLSYDGTGHLLSFYVNGALAGTTSTPITFTGSGPLDEIDLFKTSGMNGHLLDEMYFKVGYALTADDVTWLYGPSGAGRQYSDF